MTEKIMRSLVHAPSEDDEHQVQKAQASSQQINDVLREVIQ